MTGRREGSPPTHFTADEIAELQVGQVICGGIGLIFHLGTKKKKKKKICPQPISPCMKSPSWAK